MSNNTKPAAEVYEAPLAALHPSPINVHKSERRDEPALKGLAESIRACGMIHRIVVRREEDNTLTIVDGHRRFAAAKLLGLKTVPVEVVGVSRDRSLAITIAANVQRQEDDPMLEAEAIEKLTAGGMSVAQIAATIGITESKVTRRRRLSQLTQAWRNFAKRKRCTTDLLERVAAFNPELQDMVAEEVGLSAYGQDDHESMVYGWDEFDHEFAARILSLENAPFDTEKQGCWNCPHNTSTHQYLFPGMEDRENARCQNAQCFRKAAAVKVDGIIERLRKEGRPAIEIDCKWHIPEYWNTAEEEDNKHPQAYVFTDYGDVKCVLWGIKPTKASAVDEAETEQEQAEKAEAKRRQRILKVAKDKLLQACSKSMYKPGFLQSGEYRLLAAIRLNRELQEISHDGHIIWMTQEFIADAVRAGVITTDGLTVEEREIWKEATEDNPVAKEDA